MAFLFDVFTCLILSVIIIQDAKQRQIHWVLIPLLLLSILPSAFSQHSFLQTSKLFAINLGFLLLQLALLFVFFSVKNRTLPTIINTYIGLGDILLFLVLCAAFSPLNFLFFYSGSLLLSLAGYRLYRLIKADPDPTVPLAGTVSLCLVLALGLKYFFHYDFYDDSPILSLMGASA
ncbi:MAG TPA: hypothetical protein VI112_16895 [Bacteroidia bacterium]|jgi:hypothetical protein